MTQKETKKKEKEGKWLLQFLLHGARKTEKGKCWREGTFVRVCIYTLRTMEELMSALVPFQITRLTKSFIAHITFVRFLVRVNTHVALQMTRFTKTFLAHITFVRPLVRVNTCAFSNFQID